ncbi:MAG: helical backbone metal receptor [Thermanaerothrix sp.]|nr:helical backbone metal receptor [Thermanaerothrix sp.]
MNREKGAGGPLCVFSRSSVAGGPKPWGTTPKAFGLAVLLLLHLLAVPAGPAAGAPRRIVSLSPSGTEILFALGLGANVAAVTTFCDHPKEALSKPKIGGFADVSIESLLAMKADLVVLQDIHSPLARQLLRAKIPWVMLRQNSVEDVLRSIRELASACNVNDKGRSLTSSITAQMNRTAKAIQSRRSSKKPKVLVCVSREMESSRITSFYAAGPGTFYDQLITMAGGTNAVPKGSPQYPLVYPEGLMAMNPDVIIDLIGDSRFYHGSSTFNRKETFKKDNVLAQWERSFPWLGAVRSHKVAVLEGTLYLRPGPRMPKTLKGFASAIWGEEVPGKR